MLFAFREYGLSSDSTIFLVTVKFFELFRSTPTEYGISFLSKKILTLGRSSFLLSTFSTLLFLPPHSGVFFFLLPWRSAEEKGFADRAANFFFFPFGFSFDACKNWLLLLSFEGCQPPPLSLVEFSHSFPPPIYIISLLSCYFPSRASLPPSKGLFFPLARIRITLCAAPDLVPFLMALDQAGSFH